MRVYHGSPVLIYLLIISAFTIFATRVSISSYTGFTNFFWKLAELSWILYY